MRDYYRFLGKGVIDRRERQFWDYHKKALRDMGCPLGTLKLSQRVALELAGAVLSPKSTLHRLARRYGRIIPPSVIM
jgi:hypothetical protein